MDGRPVVEKETLLHGGRFIQFKELEWVDARGIARTWETADRLTPGAVLVMTRMLPSDRILLIRQYRPPAKRFVYEFPAGLMEEGETPEQAAARELREETGYMASKMRLFPPAYCSPGLSNETVHMVCADVDETAEENRHPRTAFDPGEMIESVFVDRNSLFDFYQRESCAGAAFDAKLAAYIVSQALSGIL